MARLRFVLPPYAYISIITPALRSLAAAVLMVAAITSQAEPIKSHDAKIEVLVGGSLFSNAELDRVLQNMAHERKRVDALYAAEERRCHTTFFVTPCLLEVKERHYVTLQDIKANEVAARRAKRRMRAQEKKNNSRIQSTADGQAAELPFAGNVAVSVDSKTDEKIVLPAKVLLHEPASDVEGSEDNRASKVEAYQRKVRSARARQEQIARRKANRTKTKATPGVSSIKTGE